MVGRSNLGRLRPRQCVGLPDLSFSRHAQAIANTKLDCKETPEAHVFTTDLPGLKNEELKIELVDNGSLRISGERHKEDVQETDQWHRVERSSGRFMRQFRLPDNVNADGISAKLENGVFTVNAPKIKPAVVSNSDAKPIEISANDKSKGAIVIRDLGLSQVQMLENNCGHLVS